MIFFIRFFILTSNFCLVFAWNWRIALFNIFFFDSILSNKVNMGYRLTFWINSVDWVHYMVLFKFIIMVSLTFNYFLIWTSTILFSSNSASIHLIFNTPFSIFCPNRCQLRILTIYFIIKFIIFLLMLIILRVWWVRFIQAIIWGTSWIFNFPFAFA